MISRRELLLAAGAGVCGSVLTGLGRARAMPSTRRLPRYFVLVNLHGGIDPIYSIDPKRRGEVDPDIDGPADAEAVIEAGGVTLGPWFAPLKPFARRMTFVRGVQIRTVSHPTGTSQLLRLRTLISPQMPTVLDVLGSMRKEQTVGSLAFGSIGEESYYPGFIGQMSHAFDDKKGPQARLADFDPDELRTLARAMRRQAESFSKHAPAGAPQRSVHNMQDAASFMVRTAELREQAKPDPRDALPAPKDIGVYKDLLWSLQHDMAATFLLQPNEAGQWDSHMRNKPWQKGLTDEFALKFSWLLNELENRRNAHGVLADQVVFLVGSEMGRFPVVNISAGKDHLPEASFFFVGAARGGASFGGTGRRMVGLPTLPTTGALGGKNPLVLDDLGTTLLAAAGLDPVLYGHLGKRLTFLEERLG